MQLVNIIIPSAKPGRLAVTIARTENSIPIILRGNSWAANLLTPNPTWLAQRLSLWDWRTHFNRLAADYVMSPTRRTDHPIPDGLLSLPDRSLKSMTNVRNIISWNTKQVMWQMRCQWGTLRGWRAVLTYRAHTFSTFVIRAVLKGEISWLRNWFKEHKGPVNILETKRNLLYIRCQSVPRCKHFPPRLFKDQT